VKCALVSQVTHEFTRRNIPKLDVSIRTRRNELPAIRTKGKGMRIMLVCGYALEQRNAWFVEVESFGRDLSRRLKWACQR
jgi:hypothetical protein